MSYRVTIDGATVAERVPAADVYAALSDALANALLDDLEASEWSYAVYLDAVRGDLVEDFYGPLCVERNGA